MVVNASLATVRRVAWWVVATWSGCEDLQSVGCCVVTERPNVNGRALRGGSAPLRTAWNCAFSRACGEQSRVHRRIIRIGQARRHCQLPRRLVGRDDRWLVADRGLRPCRQHLVCMSRESEQRDWLRNEGSARARKLRVVASTYEFRRWSRSRDLCSVDVPAISQRQ